MSLYTLQDPDGPEQDQPAQPGESPDSYALRALGQLIAESPLARDQFQAARFDQAQASQLEAQAALARDQASQAQARTAAEKLKAGSRRAIPRPAGAALAGLLALLDAVPAYWSAQAFGLDQTSTLIITVLLCAALGGAMWLLDLFASQNRRAALRTLQGCLAAGFTALFVLRLDYLQVTGAAGFWLAAIQALALTALSAALVAVGYVLLAHRIPKAVSDAQRAVRKAAGPAAAQAAQQARAQASASRAALEHTTLTWALAHPPDGIGHDQFLHALSHALDTLLHQ